MKYLRIVIVILVIALVGVGAYYLYLRFSPATNTPTDNQSLESGQPVQSLPEDEAAQIDSTELLDYTSADLEGIVDSLINVSGTLKSTESVGRMINDVAYNYLIKIVDPESGDLSRIWLTRPEYKAMISNAKDGDMVTVTISANGITIKKI